MVGIYLVFSQPDHPRARIAQRHPVPARESLRCGRVGYLFGLVASTLFDLPTGAIIVWAMAIVGIVFSYLERAEVRPATELSSTIPHLTVIRRADSCRPLSARIDLRRCAAGNK